MGTSMTAMLVAPEDVRGRPDGLTTTISRQEIAEALESDAPLDLYLDVQREQDGRIETTDVKVSWQRDDLQALLDRFETDEITLSFDDAELERFLDADFEAHGIREMVLLTVAAASASAALAASTASAQLPEGTGGGAAAAVVAPGHGEATTAQTLAAASVVTGHDEASTARDLAAAPIHDEGTLASRGVDQTVPGADEASPAARGVAQAATAVGTGDATTARDLSTPAIHDEATAAMRGVDQVVPGADEASLAARGVGQAAAAVGTGDATTARDLATPAIHDEATAAMRGVDQTVPGADEASLAARGIATPAVHDEATLATRGIETPAAPVDSGSSFELPSVDSGTAATIGGLAGAGLLIAGAAFAARRQRVGPA